MSNFAWLTDANGEDVLVNLDRVDFARRYGETTELRFRDCSLYVQQSLVGVMDAEIEAKSDDN